MRSSVLSISLALGALHCNAGTRPPLVPDTEAPAPAITSTEPVVTTTAADAPAARSYSVEILDGTVIMSGGWIPPDDIKAVVIPNHAAVRSCIETALRTESSVDGRIMVKVALDEAGAVLSSERVDYDPMYNGGKVNQGVTTELETCVAATFTQLVFPRPKDQRSTPQRGPQLLFVYTFGVHGE